MATTLLLDRTSWDLVLDASGNIALATEPYSQAQDAASEIRLFRGECYYDLARGIPYWQQVLGQFPPLPLMKNAFVEAALLVPGVVSAVAYIDGIANRVVTGQVQITNHAGQVSTIGVSPLTPATGSA